MDIDDILADVSREAEPQESRDLQELTRAWVAERVAPEILPYPDALMERVLERIRRQVQFFSANFWGGEKGRVRAWVNSRRARYMLTRLGRLSL